jgi:hypothetical protein
VTFVDERSTEAAKVGSFYQVIGRFRANDHFAVITEHLTKVGVAPVTVEDWSILILKWEKVTVVHGVWYWLALQYYNGTNIRKFHISAIGGMKINKNKKLGYMEFILYTSRTWVYIR